MPDEKRDRALAERDGACSLISPDGIGQEQRTTCILRFFRVVNVDQRRTNENPVHHQTHQNDQSRGYSTVRIADPHRRKNEFPPGVDLNGRA